MKIKRKPLPKSPESAFDFALAARVALARYRLEVGGPEEGQIALEMAKACGVREYPRMHPSLLISEEQTLVDAWKCGWDKRAYELRPLTEQDLREKIDAIRKDANHGCGSFYELYAQNFTSMIDDWLETIRPNERAMALEMLKGDDYSPDTNGRWVYDHEEGDIHFVET